MIGPNTFLSIKTDASFGLGEKGMVIVRTRFSALSLPPY